MKESTLVLVGLGGGLAGGIAIAATHNQSLLSAADAVAPVGTLWVNAIRMTVIPLVVAVLVTGVASAADVHAVGRLGAKTLLVFVLLLAGVRFQPAPTDVVFAVLMVVAAISFALTTPAGASGADVITRRGPFGSMTVPFDMV